MLLVAFFIGLNFQVPSLPFNVSICIFLICLPLFSLIHFAMTSRSIRTMFDELSRLEYEKREMTAIVSY